MNKDVLLGRNHMLYTKNDNLVSFFSKDLKKEIFFTYRFMSKMNNVNNIFSVEMLEDYSFGMERYFGFFLIDSQSEIQIKNVLNMFKKFIDDKTIIQLPLINENIKECLNEFAEENNFNIEWKNDCFKFKIF